MLVGILAIMAVSNAASAQTSQTLDDLAKRLKQADEIFVTAADGKEVKGRLLDVSATTLSIETKKGRLDMTAGDVARVRQRHRDSKWNGAIIGAVVTLIYPVWFCSKSYESGETCGENIEDLAMSAAMGAALGAWIDSGIKGKKTIYARKTAPTALRVAPLLSPRAIGLQISLR